MAPPLVHATFLYRTSMANPLLNHYVQTHFQMDYLHLKTSIWIEFSLPILCTNFAKMFVVFVIAYKFNGLLKTLLIASSGIHRGFHSAIRTFLRFCFTTACMVDFDPKELVFWPTLTFHLWRSFVTIFMNMPHGVPLLRMTYTSIQRRSRVPSIILCRSCQCACRPCCISRLLHATI